ncbi:IPT/TIG domain-containing protein [Persicitalea sp.]|uniref:IPT/TIG domain-containing protein n=1 Tax=Persicitalea sp. TaxID=3100273 RepID=UPI003593D4A3
MKTFLLYVPKQSAIVLILMFTVISCKKTAEPAPFSIASMSPEQGIVGTTVTIQGEGFSATPTENLVKFNGTSATVTAATATQLTTSVPAGTKTGRVTVETDGRTATSTTDFVVIQEPYITSFSPAQAEEGEEVMITGSGFKKSTLVVKFNGINATVFNANSDTQLFAFVPDGATTGKISVEGNGNVSTSSTDFTVIIPLTAKATVTKLAGIPAYPTSGADGVRMALASDDKSLYLTGPGQKTVYRMDLTTLGVAPFQTITDNPVGVAVSSDQIFFGESGPGYYYTYRFDKLSKSTAANPNARPWSLKSASGATAGKYSYICTNFNNELFGITNGTAGGNTASSFTATLVNSQLKGTPDQANAHLATNGKSVFVSGNNALWKLQADNTLKLVAGAPGQKGYADGSASTARFQDGGYARGNAITVDEKDNVYLTDYGCGCIRKVDDQGNVTTVAGKKTASARTGKGNRMRFNFDSWDIALAKDGALYVIATNDVSSQTLRFAVYKVVFNP